MVTQGVRKMTDSIGSLGSIATQLTQMQNTLPTVSAPPPPPVVAEQTVPQQTVAPAEGSRGAILDVKA